jgi:chemotaxis protein MotA
MFAIIGIVTGVSGPVLAGFLMEHGRIAILLQPPELLIIGGAGAGTLLIVNALRILEKVGNGG